MLAEISAYLGDPEVERNIESGELKHLNMPNKRYIFLLSSPIFKVSAEGSQRSLPRLPEAGSLRNRHGLALFRGAIAVLGNASRWNE